ncbi:Aluminum-activated malate transporter 1 [Dichanthelium oligosanthes]|uniref:Aluminum-activated malate transporter 1 n=1 Tax=Dichanthelium oligosanthes TaxID=888268 RepID=A0A1E5VW18_9POAL|nr:Aluminum-activated malate transporter 1 [Dichanthelium oligosanthes]
MEAPAAAATDSSSSNNGGADEGSRVRSWQQRLRWAPQRVWLSAVRLAEKVAQGAPLQSKGLNRAFATVVASFLAVGAHEEASLVVPSSEKAEFILLVLFIFFLASAATFSRFIPEIKARYDYGVSIFILTFSLVDVSSYRVEELMPLALQRASTLFAGVAICLCTTVFVFPFWAGEDLHNLAAGNLDKLGEFLEGMESECFGENARIENLEGKNFLQASSVPRTKRIHCQSRAMLEGSDNMRSNELALC